FSPGSALAGGLLIGTAAALLVLLGGRIAGISGILGGLLRRVPGERAWRLAFVAGLAASPWLHGAIAAPLQPRIGTGWGLLLL
ncbi:YeeE/YedE family protein, partial [Salmonella enterica]|uniref:YeeE/YedE family protein n=1 Tax=Salmonella enterica TaxID=28901 RepID=UPI0039EC6123